MKTYTLEVSHAGIHALGAALDLAFAVRANDVDTAELTSRQFGASTDTPARNLAAVRARRDLLAAHRDAVKDDGHGDEFVSEPLEGTDLADAMSEFDTVLARFEREIAQMENEIA